jgi:hypothetical protein
MRIHNGILNCVCFLGVHRHKGSRGVFEPIGTAFLVAVGDHRVKQNATYYLVTARHILDKAAGKGGLYARMNDRVGGFEYVRLHGTWARSETADVAAIPFAVQGKRDYYGDNLDKLPYWLLHQEQWATDEKLAALQICPSDEIAVTGLFVTHKGDGKNLPIIRGGTIAAMPDPSEPIQTDDGLRAPGYLVEVHSSGGLSGSPVLVMTETHRQKDGTISQINPGTLLLGIVRGGWQFDLQIRAKTTKLLDVEFAMPPAIRDQMTELNRGIAIVTPIQELTALLDREDVKREREEQSAKERHEIAKIHGVADDDDLRAGPEPERLKIKGPMDQAVKKMFKKGKPPKGSV